MEQDKRELNLDELEKINGGASGEISYPFTEEDKKLSLLTRKRTVTIRPTKTSRRKFCLLLQGKIDRKPGKHCITPGRLRPPFVHSPARPGSSP